MKSKKFEALFKALLVLADLGSLVLAANLAFDLRYYVDWHGLFAPGPSPWGELYRALPFMMLAYVTVFVLVGLYRGGMNKKEELFLLFKGVALAFCVIFALGFFYRGFSYSRVAAVFMLFLAFVMNELFRLVMRVIKAKVFKGNSVHGQQPTNLEPQDTKPLPAEPVVTLPEATKESSAGPMDSEPEATKESSAEVAVTTPADKIKPSEAQGENQEPVIRVNNASVRYKAFKSRRKNLREALFRSVLRRDERIDIWALKDVSFEVGPGESLGVIGENGAGKSTLCLLLSKIMSPTSGSVEVGGNVSALLSLGAGFQLDLTGRDNIFLNGVYMGFTLEQMRGKFHEILEFSGIKDYIDMPVRTYSSGMRARLAFSIAAIVEPEIMIIDELMGVGDMKFRQKSTERMKEMITKSKALVVVSHSMETIRSLCTRAVWLDKGHLVAEGSVEEVVRQYEAS